MKKIILSAIVATAVLQASNKNLGEITVTTATKTEKKIEGVSASVIVISEQEIEQLGASNLGDVLQRTPGLVRQYGTFPSASSKSKSSISIRGMGATGTLFLIDGERMAGEVNNPYDLDRIPASAIERIEIVKGPMSTLYGADAVGGVINIITKQPTEDFGGSFNIRTGANEEGDGANSNVDLSFRGKKDKFSYSAYANGSKSTPYTQSETTDTRVGGGKAKPSQLPQSPGYLNPDGPTGGKPFYLQSDGSVNPKPLDPKLVNRDKQAAQQSFGSFRDDVSSNVKDSYDTDVTYREKSDIFTIGTQLGYELTDQLKAGVLLSYMNEERWGTYNGNFHPMGYTPPTGHKKNPIVGHNPDGVPVSVSDKKGHTMGKCPSWNVPINSHDENTRRRISGNLKWNTNEDLFLKLVVYNDYYEKRNTTTMKEWQDFGYQNEEKSAANGMNANVDITSYELSGNYALTDLHLLTFGTEYRDEKRDATVFDDTPGMTRQNVDYTSVYLQDEWEMSDTINIVLGGRYDEISNAENKPTFKVGAVKSFSKLFNLRANFAQGYRTPDIREMYINKQTPAGLQLGAEVLGYDLKPEFTNAFEIGLRGNRGGFNYDVDIFYNQINDRIQYTQVSDPVMGEYWTFQNLSNAETKGLEAAVMYDFDNGLYTTLTWIELRTKDKETGKELIFNPDRVIALKADYTVYDGFVLSGIATYTGEQYYTKKTPAGLKDETTDPYTLVDLTGTYQFGQDKKYELYGGVYNIFGEEVDDILGSNVGRYFFAGARIKF